MFDEYLMSPLIPELYCSNIKTSLSFYTAILGFNIQYQREEDGFAMLERQDSRIMLEEINNNPDSDARRTWVASILEKPFGRGVNLQIKTTMIDALFERVRQSGTHIFLTIEEKWYRVRDLEVGHRQFIVLDPD